MLRYVRLLRLFFRTELQYELEYRLNLLLEIVQTIVVTATSVAAILVLFSYTTALNGWDLGAMLVLLGCFYLCLLYTSPSPRDRQKSRMPSSA